MFQKISVAVLLCTGLSACSSKKERTGPPDKSVSPSDHPPGVVVLNNLPDKPGKKSPSQPSTKK